MLFSSITKFAKFYISIFTLVLFLHVCTPQSTSRVVFPEDFVRFQCIKSPTSELSTKGSSSSLCTWTFKLKGTDEISTQAEAACTKAENGDKKVTQGDTNDVYEGYVKVPPQAMDIVCIESGGVSNNPQSLDIQPVGIANPLLRIEQSSPKIILQRFSDDFGARLAAHDVTNQTIKINGKEVESLKLLCIHSKPVSWKGVTESYQRVFKDLNERDKKWLHSKSQDLQPSWNAYLRLSSLQKSFQDFETRTSKDQITYTSTLNIQHITNMTSRKYECTESKEKEVSSYVSLTVDSPRALGPDEIQLIDQILSILDSMSQGKGQGREPWYTLGSLMSIILILFMYYCKKKLDQPQSPTPVKTVAATEETEMRTRLQNPPLADHQIGGQNDSEPVSVVAT